MLSSFQRSNAAPAQSKPGPMFAVVAGARTRTGPLTTAGSNENLDDRVHVDLDDLRADPLDRVRVLEPVAGDHGDDGPRRADLANRGDARCARGLAEDPLELRKTAPVRDYLVVGELDDGAARIADRRLGLGTMRRLRNPNRGRQRVVAARCRACEEARHTGAPLGEAASVGARIAAAAV